MTRRKLLSWLGVGGSLGILSYVVGHTVKHFIPRPPRKIFIKEAELPPPSMVKVGEEYFLVKLQDGKLRALSRRCPHLGCKVNYWPPKEIFLCPCHQSRFALTGAYLSGPAPRGLYELKWERSEGGILLEIPG